MPVLPRNTRIFLGDADLTLTSAMKDVVSAVADGVSPVLVGGRAGTGKSSLLKYIQRLATRPVAVLAPTGVAAVNAEGATIHSFFRFPPKLLSQQKIERSESLSQVCNCLDGIIIDEVSMVRADMMDAIDASLKVHRRSSAPFGGIQMLFFGDLAQLPPVVADQALQEYFSSVYESPFFFDAASLRFQRLERHDLDEVFRQRDPHFVQLLDRVSTATATSDDLRLLNGRVARDAWQGKPDAIVLTTTRRSALTTNKSRLDALPLGRREFSAIVSGQVPQEYFPTERVLELKPAARVMMLRNNGSKWQNGTIGTLVGFDRHEGEEALQIQIGSATYSVTPHTWEVIRYTADSANGRLREEVVGTYRQFPVKLAWAVTIHKSQGLTFDEVVIDLDRGAFDHGQLYVALSRCRTLNGSC